MNCSDSRSGFDVTPQGRSRLAAPLLLCLSCLLWPSVSARSDDAVSREVSLFNLGQPAATIEAFTRELSVYTTTNVTRPEAISREVSVFLTINPVRFIV